MGGWATNTWQIIPTYDPPKENDTGLITFVKWHGFPPDLLGVNLPLMYGQCVPPQELLDSSKSKRKRAAVLLLDD